MTQVGRLVDPVRVSALAIAASGGYRQGGGIAHSGT